MRYILISSLKKRKGERKMHRKYIIVLATLLALVLMVIPTFAWVRPGEITDDGYYEDIGARIDRILIKMYATQEAEWDALEAGDIDLTDWPLTDYYIDRWSTTPQSENIKMVNYGGEAGYFIIDINNNPHEYLGLPEDPTFPNPVYPNPTSEATLRHAIAHMIDRTWIITEVTAGLGLPMYTVMPTYMAGYVHPDIKPGEAYEDLCHLFDPEEAARILAGTKVPICTSDLYQFCTYICVEQGGKMHVADGDVVVNKATGATVPTCVDVMIAAGEIYHVDDTDGANIHFKDPVDPNKALARYSTTKQKFPKGADGWRYWDSNGNCVKDPGEDFTLIFYARADDSKRLMVGDDLYEKLTAYPIQIHVDYRPMDRATCSDEVMGAKNFNLYTGGWIFVGPDPDHAYYLYTPEWYWHPGKPINYGFCGVDLAPDDPYIVAANKTALANTVGEALEGAMTWQELFATPTLIPAVPLWCEPGVKGVRRRYTGGTNEATVSPDDGENAFRGEYWTGIVNEMGFGVNSWWTKLNIHTDGHAVGDGEHMTLRYGFKSATLDKLNPLYASWYWDWEVMDMCYDSMLLRDPYDLTWRPFIAYDWVPSTWDDGGVTKTMVTYYLNDSVYWQDGTQLTGEDVKFSLITIRDTLAARGLPDPWWISNVAEIKEVNLYDGGFTVEVKFDVKSYACEGMAGGNIILPKHIWEDIVTSGDPTLFQPEPTLMGSGPYMFVEYTPYSHILLEKNPNHWLLPPELRHFPPRAMFSPRTGQRFYLGPRGETGTNYNVTITYDASMSTSGWDYGTEYIITEYRWDLDGDGSLETTTTKKTVNCTYYTFNYDLEVTLEVYAPGSPVRDTDTVTHHIYITEWFGHPEYYLGGPVDFCTTAADWIPNGHTDGSDFIWFRKFYAESAAWRKYCLKYGIRWPVPWS